jgi:hypothetical protein
MLATHEFLSPEECAHISAIVMGLKEFWVNRTSGLLPFYTLGAASYLDHSPTNEEAYAQAVQRYNPILESHFPKLYEQLLERFAEILKIPVVYAEGMALPGFHIFLSSIAFQYPMGSIHFDLQYQKFKWGYEKVDKEHPISFTCPIAMPESGSGLNYWKISPKEGAHLSALELEKLKQKHEQFYFPYKLGTLVLHETQFLHQIAPSKNLQPDDCRITLQGHGLVCDDIMRLYW